MKNAISIFCLLFLASSLSAQHAPWEKTAGPPGLTVKVLYRADSVMYAGTETQGLYKSTDDGLSWIAANNGIERVSVTDIISSGGNLLVAAASRANECPALNNIFKSTDNGTTWIPTSGLGGKIPKAFAIKDSSIYATTAFSPGSSGVSRSTDNGNTWQEVPSPIQNGNEIFVSGNAIIVA